MASVILKRINDICKGKIPLSAKRSDKWEEVRANYLKLHPSCAVCGGLDKLEVHHIHPFHLHPELELEESNLITLCEYGDDGLICHLAIGHLGNYKSFNVDVVKDAEYLLNKIVNRPLGEL